MNTLSNAPRNRTAWYRDPRSLAYRATLLAVPLLFAVATIRAVRFSLPQPDFWSQAQSLLTTGHATQSFVPEGYAAFLAAGIALGHAHPMLGVEALQALLQLGIVVTAWCLARRFAAPPAAALMAALLLAIHPELLLNITKAWDVSLSVFLLLALVLLKLKAMQQQPSWRSELALAVLLAAACLVRPNYAVLAIPLLWPGQTVINRARRSLALSSIAILAYIAMSAALYGSPIWPGNGPYNLYAGQNPQSEQALLQHENAEPSIAWMLPHGVLIGDRIVVDLHDLSLRPIYTRAAADFALSHPILETRLVTVKAFTLLRPDTKGPATGLLQHVVKWLMAAPFFVWMGLVIWSRRRTNSDWTSADTLVCWVVAIYAMPFLITNADPRFRTPLDVLLIAHSMGLGTRGVPRNSQPGPNNSSAEASPSAKPLQWN